MYLKMSDAVKGFGEGLKSAAMSRDEVMENLKKLEDPDVAKEVGDALVRMRKGSTIEAAANSKMIQTILLALMTYIGSVFADPTIKKDFGLMLKGGPVTLKDVNTFKQQADDMKSDLDTLNRALKDRSGMDKPMQSVMKIGDEKLVATNQREYKILQAMTDLVNTLKENRAKKLISDKTFKDKVDALVEAFKSKSTKPVVFA